MIASDQMILMARVIPAAGVAVVELKRKETGWTVSDLAGSE